MDLKEWPPMWSQFMEKSNPPFADMGARHKTGNTEYVAGKFKKGSKLEYSIPVA